MVRFKKLFKTGNVKKKVWKGKYFYPIVIIAGFSIATFVVLYLGSAPSLYQLKESDISSRTIYAPYNFTYPTSVDEEKTEKARKEFAEKTLPVYDIDTNVQEKAFAKLDNFFDNLREAKLIPGLSEKEKAEIAKAKTASALSEKNIASLMASDEPARLRKSAKDALENVYLIGILGDKDKESLKAKNEEKVIMRNEHFKIERELVTKGLVDEKEAQKIARATIERIMPKPGRQRSALEDLIKDEVVKNVNFNEEETALRKANAMDEVPPIYERKTVKKNELIVEKGTRLTKDDIAKLAQITRIHAVVNRTSYLSGLFIILMGLILIAAIYLAFSERKLIQKPKYVLLIAINAFLAILLSLVIIQAAQPVYLIPLASIGMILVLLLSTNVAFAATLALSIFIGFMAGGRLSLALMLFVGSAVGIYAVRGARKRSQIFFAGFIVSAINFFAILGIGLFNNLGREVILKEGLYGIANGIISSFIVIGLLPVFEYFFRLITNITLLELSDLSNPLLKELTIKAPGTYHHSILVGNLAEEACNSIGANSLLARVGAYYHDIGKIEKAEYFAENEMRTNSKHERLTPSMSALIITNHTKDGVELARKYKLNPAITDFISQHHGTSLIYFFYQKALERVQSEGELKEEEFRYPGPKAQTKEAAIVLLADSVEASSRMLSDPTPARIRGLVQKIINNKFIDGQLDECELTLRDLNKIAESFVRVLMGVFHTRLEYPDIKPRKEKKNAFKNKNKESK